MTIEEDNTMQEYFWTEKWQTWEEKADADLREGCYADFDSVEALIIDLRGTKEIRSPQTT